MVDDVSLPSDAKERFFFFFWAAIMSRLFDACINGVDPPEDNTFSKIIDRALPADILYEDDAFMAFADHRPASQCHVLVIPKVGAIRSMHFLQPKHLDMLESMLAIAKQVIREEARCVTLCVLICGMVLS